MKDPQRLVDLSGDSPERRLLESALGDAGSPQAQASALNAFGATLGLVGQGGSALAASGSLAKTALAPLVVKWALGGTLAAATGLGALATIDAYHGNRTLPVESRAKPSPGSLVRSLARSQAVPLGRQAAREDTAGATATEATATDPGSAAKVPSAEPGLERLPDRVVPVPAEALETRGAADLAREVALLQRARLALGRGDMRAALAAIDQRDRQFAGGSLGPEAAVLRVETLVRLGDLGAARAVADGFLSRQPRGPYADRMRALVRSKIP